ncbi:MAG: LLM class flavin-dependent oxidoreductase, partial [Myxococcota bacterium]
WMVYPRSPSAQAALVEDWNRRVHAAGRPSQPVVQPLYVDLLDDPEAPPSPLHLGLRLGASALRDHLKQLEDAGVGHVALNLRFDHGDVEATLERLAADVLPHFPLAEVSS